MAGFLPTPGQEALAQGGEVMFQDIGFASLRERGFPVPVGIEVQQPYIDHWE